MTMINGEVSYSKIVDIKRLDFILETLRKELPADGKILDVGCGNGIISMNVGVFGYNVLGVDVSEKAIQKAIQKNQLPNVRFEVKSAEALAAEGPQFDAIICSEVIEHLHNPSILLSTINKALKSSGVLIVTVPNGFGPRESLVTKPILKLRGKNNWAWRMVLKIKSLLGYSGTTTQSAADNLDHVQFFSKKHLISLLNENEFKLVKFGKSNFMDDVFPISFFTNRIKLLQKFDCKLADYLPYQLTGGFNTVWQKNEISSKI